MLGKIADNDSAFFIHTLSCEDKYSRMLMHTKCENMVCHPNCVQFVGHLFGHFFNDAGVIRGIFHSNLYLGHIRI